MAAGADGAAGPRQGQGPAIALLVATIGAVGHSTSPQPPRTGPTPLARLYRTTTPALLRTGRESSRRLHRLSRIRSTPLRRSDAKRLTDQQDAYYNLGNALYRAGQQVEKSAPQEAIAKWTDAVKAYETALQLRADDADSKFNRDFVKRKIDALQQPRLMGAVVGAAALAAAVGAGAGPAVAVARDSRPRPTVRAILLHPPVVRGNRPRPDPTDRANLRRRKTNRVNSHPRQANPRPDNFTRSPPSRGRADRRVRLRRRRDPTARRTGNRGLG